MRRGSLQQDGRAGIRWRALWPLLCGALAALGQAPLGLWPATLIGFAVLLRAPGGFGRGWLFGAGYFLTALHWIYAPFLVEAERFGWMAPFAVLAMAGGLALFWGAALGVARGLRGGAVVTLALAEVARAQVLTGFPWAAPGQVWVDTPLAQLSAWIGPQGMTLLTLALAWALARGAEPGRRVWLAVCALGLVALWGAGSWRAAQPVRARTAPVTLRLVQANAPQHLKFHPDYAYDYYARGVLLSAEPRAQFPEGGPEDPVRCAPPCTRAPASAVNPPAAAQVPVPEAVPAISTPPDLVIWPETAVPWWLPHSAPQIAAIAEAAGAPVVTGVQRIDAQGTYRNSLVVTDKIGEITETYDKHHLVPFGEYIPLGGLGRYVGLGSFASSDGFGYIPGPGARVLDLGAAGRALPLICYEGIFPRDIAAAPERAEWLLQITNDAWFGRFAGPRQHLAQMRLRAVEQGLPVVRVANTGISALIDPRGAVLTRIPLGQAGSVDVTLPGALAPTLFTRVGHGPVYLVLLAGLGALLIRRWRGL